MVLVIDGMSSCVGDCKDGCGGGVGFVCINGKVWKVSFQIYIIFYIYLYLIGYVQKTMNGITKTAVRCFPGCN